MYDLFFPLKNDHHSIQPIFFDDLANRKPNANPMARNPTMKMIRDMMIFQKKIWSSTMAEF
jgi:hypothetical protein